MALLETVQSPLDLHKFSKKELYSLAEEIRKKIIQTVSKNGGHLASNLGVVELTIALLRTFPEHENRIVYDVGHQCYTHKLLTGRQGSFDTLRQHEGLSGFPKREESPYDAANSGHASTSISIALGMLEGMRRQGKRGKVVAVIGDGALSGGMAFEALCHAGHLAKDLIVILNDNKMSINANIGALSRYLSTLTSGKRYQGFRKKIDEIVLSIPFAGKALMSSIVRFKRTLKALFFKENLFCDLGFEYAGPIDGHSIGRLEDVLKRVCEIDKPVVVHVITHKGRGYRHAEGDPAHFHGIQPFSILDGKVETKKALTFTEAFSDAMMSEAAKNQKLTAITAAMTKGTGLAAFSHAYPERFYDVSIAEQHAVTFAAGLALSGLKPVVALYSTFIQRAYDQVIHDVALQNLPVVFALDRSGPVPDDGETHQGLYDLAAFRCIPNIEILAPAGKLEMDNALSYALSLSGPSMIRYPKCEVPKENPCFALPMERGRGVFARKSDAEILIISLGALFTEAVEASNTLAHEHIMTDLYNLRFVKPIDLSFFLEVCSAYKLVVFAEEGAKTGGVGEMLASLVLSSLKNTRFVALGAHDKFYKQGSREELLSAMGISSTDICEAVRAKLPLF